MKSELIIILFFLDYTEPKFLKYYSHLITFLYEWAIYFTAHLFIRVLVLCFIWMGS